MDSWKADLACTHVAHLTYIFTNSPHHPNSGCQFRVDFNLLLITFIKACWGLHRLHVSQLAALDPGVALISPKA